MLFRSSDIGDVLVVAEILGDIIDRAQDIVHDLLAGKRLRYFLFGPTSCCNPCVHGVFRDADFLGDDVLRCTLHVQELGELFQLGSYSFTHS